MRKTLLIGALTAVLFRLIVLTALPIAYAGPPFLTDDPEVVPYRHAEINFFSQGTNTERKMAGVLPGIDANYGLFLDVQIHILAQMSYNATSEKHSLSGDLSDIPYDYGYTEFGVKYSFISETSRRPLVAVYPFIEVPTSGRDFGAGNYQEFLPVWLEKNFGPWQTFGGGGYWINPGDKNKNYWFSAWALERKVTEDLTLGGELFRQTASTADGRDSSGFNLGGSYSFSEKYHLLFSAGRGIENVNETNQLSYYLALQWEY